MTFWEKPQQFTSKYSRMKDNLDSGQGQSTKSVEQVCHIRDIKTKCKIIHSPMSNVQGDICFPNFVSSKKFITAIILIQIQLCSKIEGGAFLDAHFPGNK